MQNKSKTLKHFTTFFCKCFILRMTMSLVFMLFSVWLWECCMQQRMGATFLVVWCSEGNFSSICVIS